MRLPERVLVRTWIDTEDVRHSGGFELLVQPLVLGAEEHVAVADVERALARRFATDVPSSKGAVPAGFVGWK